MKKQTTLQELEDTRLDKEIKRTLQREFPLPEKAEEAKNAAFAKIRAAQEEQEDCTAQAEQKGCTARKVPNSTKAAVRNSTKVTVSKSAKKQRSRSLFMKICAGMVAAAAAFSGVCIANPAFAAQIPLVGHVFEELGESLGFSGDFSKYAEPLVEPNNEEADSSATGAADRTASADGNETGAGNSTVGNTLYTQTQNGMTVTLSEFYCNSEALYISMLLETEEVFPETMKFQGDGAPVIGLDGGTIKFSYNDQKLWLDGVGNMLDGKMIDDHTYAGVLRYNLAYSTDTSDYDGYYEARTEFYKSLGFTQEELDNNSNETYEKLKDTLGVEELTEENIAKAGGPDMKDYRSTMEISDTFSATLSFDKIVGTKPDAAQPEMPEDLRAEYEAAMAEKGLSIADEDYESFTEEQKEIEHQLYTNMMNAYMERYPETAYHPNQYENWWVDGPWEFTFDVAKDTSQTIVKEIHDVDENGMGLESVTKTPFEITYQDGRGIDYLTAVLDADGNLMEGGTFGGDANVLAIHDRDVSKIDVYICDYYEYMDELKGYYWSEDYEENKKTKTFKQLLDERALYHKEIVFDE